MIRHLLSAILIPEGAHASGCHVSTPDPFLCAHSHTRCGQPYHLRLPLSCPHGSKQLVYFRVLAHSADRTGLVNRDMTTDADTRVPNRTPMSPLCLCYRYAPYCTARTTQYCRSTCPAATHSCLVLVLQLLMSCHKVLYLLLLGTTSGNVDTPPHEEAAETRA